MKKTKLLLIICSILAMTACSKKETIYGAATPEPEKTATFTWNDQVLQYVYCIVKKGPQWQWRTIHDGAPTTNQLHVDKLQHGDSVVFRGIMMSGDTVYLTTLLSYPSTENRTDTITELDFTKSIYIQ